ncbi:hypothetical protein H5410_018545, partial [Solanum commersonii]
MAVTTFTEENTSPLPPKRIFKASIVDSHNLIPKLMPQAIKSIEVQGDGGAGSIKTINFPDGGNFKSIKYRVDELNEEAYTYKYTLIEGDGLVDNLEKITYDVKFEKSADGGSISKVTSSYYTVGDFKLKEEEIKAGKEKVLAMFKAENTSPLPPKRIFKASIVDSHNLIPKLMPQAIKSIEVQGDGGAGSIKTINFPDDGNFKSIKYRVDELNEDTYTYKYTLIEGGGLVDNLQKITYDVKFEQSTDGGSISKVTSSYYTVGDFKLKEEEIKAGKEKVLAMFKALMPQAIKSIEVQGDGDAGSIKTINFPDGGNFKSIKYRVDELNEETYTYKYTMIEGDGLVDNLEKITYDVKFEQSADGGSISKVTSSYYTVGDFKLKEEEIKAGKEKVLAMFKA